MAPSGSSGSGSGRTGSGAGSGAEPLPWGRPRDSVAQPARSSRVPRLVDICLTVLARNLDYIVDVRPIQEEALCLSLLHRIITQGKLDYRLAKIFQKCGHADIEQALETADLLSALPGAADPKQSHSSCQQKFP
mmetsp:Transcript_17157/g.40761  ORF Transcript_17157/g.40761 Transcript_17157/m.40761 type:complete len:134 (-) Transcript_17157:174-575(-)